MSEIFDIREFKAVSETKKSQSFLSVNAIGAVNGAVFDWGPSKNQNWSNQELAEFYRVKKFFSLYKIFIVTDAGLSDEGDPWFVYCNQQGDVFAHFCKINGKYLLDSPKLSKVIIALSLRELVDNFCADEFEKNKKIEELKNNVVVLHPAIQFTSLVLALYVATDPMGSKAHAETNVALNDAFIHFNLVNNVESSIFEHHTDKKDIIDQDLYMVFKNIISKFDIDDHEYYITIATIAGIASCIASAIEFNDEIKSFLMLASVNDTENSILTSASLPVTSDEFNFINLNKESEFLNHTDNKFLNNENQIKLEFTNDELTQTVNFENSSDNSSYFIPKPNNDNSNSNMLNIENMQLTIQSNQNYNFVLSQLNVPVVEPKSNIINIEQFKETLSSLNRYETVTSITISNLSDNNAYILNDLSKINGLEKILIFSGLNGTNNELNPVSSLSTSLDEKKVSLVTNQTPDTSLQAYNDQVRQVLDFILGKGDHITILNLPKEVIFVDDNAMNSLNDKITARSWTTKDGGVISLVGYVKDFNDFKLLAS